VGSKWIGQIGGRFEIVKLKREPCTKLYSEKGTLHRAICTNLLGKCHPFVDIFLLLLKKMFVMMKYDCCCNDLVSSLWMTSRIIIVL
jgi:hypothetical protein